VLPLPRLLGTDIVDEKKAQEIAEALLSRVVQRSVEVGRRSVPRDLRFSFEPVQHQYQPSPQELATAAAQVAQVPPVTAPIVFNFNEWEAALRHYPDQLAALLLLDTIRCGANLCYDGPRGPRVEPVQQFLRPKAFQHHYAEVDESLEAERAARRLSGWYKVQSGLPIPNLRLVPLSVTEKKENGQVVGYRLIHDHSFPVEGAMNTHIQKLWMQMDVMDTILQAVHSAGKGAHLAKFDIKSAFRLIRVRAQDLAGCIVEQSRQAGVWHRGVLGLRWSDVTTNLGALSHSAGMGHNRLHGGQSAALGG
jgi:hypothetical protein